MRFSVDAHAIGRHLTGNEAYVRNLLAGFAGLKDTAEFHAYVSVQGSADSVPQGIRTSYVSENPYIRLGFDLSRNLRKHKPNLLHVQYTGPLACPVPVVTSVHDISFLEHPEYFTSFRAAQLRLTVGRTIRTAAKILTLSEFSKDRILRAYGVEPDKVVIVPGAVSEIYRPLPREAAQKHISGKFNISSPYLLMVGDLQPRKNQLGLIAAYEDLIVNNPNLPQHLVLVGKDTWFSPRIHEAALHSRVKDRIHFTGYVTEQDLIQFYAGCDAYIFPSFYEGFGLPILEAMACGRAVACAKTSAIPEVADGAALLFDPESKSELVRAMRDLLIDSELRLRMERLGQQNAARFSWRSTARKTLDVYYEVAEKSSSRAQHAMPSVSV